MRSYAEDSTPRYLSEHHLRKALKRNDRIAAIMIATIVLNIACVVWNIWLCKSKLL
jgi:hypothetical protein